MAPSVAAIIVAAGRGLRAGGSDLPKQYRQLASEPVIRSSLALFAWHGEVGAVQAVIHPEDRGPYEAASAGLRLLPPVLGGATRQASVRAGLEALSGRPPDIVLVHDAARPFCSSALVSRAIAAGIESGAAVPALDVTDTIKRIAPDGRVAGTVDRTQLRAVQTPQAFAFKPLVDAHRRARMEGRDDFTDDAALAEWAGLKVTTFAGETGNLKLTTDEDFARAEARRIASLTDLRTGSGFDVHAFGDGDHVMLGGVRIAHDRGLVGHSDADVALHAIVDAILGALADGDIGKHFSPNDPRWRSASSDHSPSNA
jgi:2-C-methyl-D-erythritol 4-phosphate cytidylyltransferase / 2-C-methyl-D-erythritol 2,4-cyclodiphosphate synthase